MKTHLQMARNPAPYQIPLYYPPMGPSIMPKTKYNNDTHLGNKLRDYIGVSTAEIKRLRGDLTAYRQEMNSDKAVAFPKEKVNVGNLIDGISDDESPIRPASPINSPPPSRPASPVYSTDSETASDWREQLALRPNSPIQSEDESVGTWAGFANFLKDEVVDNFLGNYKSDAESGNPLASAISNMYSNNESESETEVSDSDSGYASFVSAHDPDSDYVPSLSEATLSDDEYVGPTGGGGVLAPISESGNNSPTSVSDFDGTDDDEEQYAGGAEYKPDLLPPRYKNKTVKDLRRELAKMKIKVPTGMKAKDLQAFALENGIRVMR
tara:strand:+ start:1171 stop:2142 length:972 start_codon:yes stop_codon:yes gene_type:complete